MFYFFTPQVLRFAKSINQRIADRAAKHIPTPAAGKVAHTKVVDGQFIERRCAACGVWQLDTDRKLERCSGCMRVYYCGRECQKKDWKEHKKDCGGGV